MESSESRCCSVFALVRAYQAWESWRKSIEGSVQELVIKRRWLKRRPGPPLQFREKISLFSRKFCSSRGAVGHAMLMPHRADLIPAPTPRRLLGLEVEIYNVLQCRMNSISRRPDAQSNGVSVMAMQARGAGKKTLYPMAQRTTLAAWKKGSQRVCGAVAFLMQAPFRGLRHYLGRKTVPFFSHVQGVGGLRHYTRRHSTKLRMRAALPFRRSVTSWRVRFEAAGNVLLIAVALVCGHRQAFPC